MNGCSRGPLNIEGKPLEFGMNRGCFAFYCRKVDTHLKTTSPEAIQIRSELILVIAIFLRNNL